MSATDVTTLTRRSAVELAAMIARGEVSSAEVVEAHLARIEAVNPVLNAVVVRRYEEARAEARAADERRVQGEPLGPLHGVPVTIKEAFAVAGTPATYGLPVRAAILASEDDVYVARLRSAGAIVVAKTNVAQVLLFNETDNPVYGRTNNPWDVARTPGGSSGGEAAIIAAGGSPLGLASDIAGSIRTPSTFCGVAGMRPTAGRLPDLAFWGMSLGQQAIPSQVGALARHVDDVALALKILNGGANPAVEPPQPLGDPSSVEIAKLRVAYYADDGVLAVAPAVRRAVVEAAGMLAGQGAQVVEWTPPDVYRAADLIFGLLGADGGRGLKQVLAGNKRDPRIAQLVLLAGRSPAALAALGGLLRLAGQRQTAAIVRNFGHKDTLHYWRLVEAQQAYRRQFAHALDADDGGPFDVIVAPAHSLPALPHGASRNLVIAGGYAVLYNVLGYPAGVVPVTRVRPGEETQRKRSADIVERAARKAELGSAGLPIGVQVVARPWREHVALAAMRTIEAQARTRPDFPDQAPI
jgi:fatty acid amide hydrolase